MDSDMFEVFDEQPVSGRHRSETNVATRKKRFANGEPKANNSVSSVDGQSAATDGESEPKRRRRLNSHAESQEEEEGEIDEDEDEDEDDDNEEDNTSRALKAPATRQPRKNPQAPIAVDTDSFQTELSREVAAAQGLQAQKDDQAVVLSHQVRHQVSIPLGYEYTPIHHHKPSANPAKTYPFQLDPFQQVAVNSIERNESVLVSAHTSAGKTVVAEYAIAQCLKNNQRVIYTSPIKALSNQKYREFNAEFGDVGLMTGDVTINPTATCLVMTTEILRSMLYRGSEIMREVAWVVFDEVHYLRDASRGVVWEETIILLPDKVRYVFLSATIPNAMQFAEWIVKTHNQPCHVVYTDFRPTPLQHYLFPAGGDGIMLVVDEKGVFREENFNKAMELIAAKRGDDPSDPNARRKGKGKDKRLNKGGNKDDSDIYKIIKMIMQKSFNPVIVFSFSKRECENYALQMSSLAFNDDSEKQMVSKVFSSALEMLSEEDRNLPQITNILPLLRRGIGIHHSGLLPILKETIEILFQEGLLKVLFATETFSIGLNMPAKTVVFTKVRKFDGVGQRWLTPSEFIQMSGRAGRRGLDERGLVIMMIDEQMEPSVGKEIVRGQQDNLKSAFHLGYNMILNLMRVEGISPEYMLEHCFYQFQNTASVAGLELELEKLEAERAEFVVPDEDLVREYYDLRKQLDKYTKDMKEVITHPSYALPFMQGGRLVKVKYQEFDFGWGVVVDYKERQPHRPTDARPQDNYVVNCLLAVSANPPSIMQNGQAWLPGGVAPPGMGEETRMEVVPVLLSCIESIGHVRLFLPKELRTPEQRQTVRKSLNEVKRRFPDGITVLDPIENMGITDDGFKKLFRKIEVLESRLLGSALHGSDRLPELYNLYARKQDMSQKIRDIKKRISNALAVMHMDELKSRKRVLRRLGFINDTDVVQLKARVACEISTGDELVLSELLFNRFFNEMSPEVCAACLSCFIFEERTELKDPLREELTKPFQAIQAQARTVAKISQESKLSVNEDEYLQSFKSELMGVVYAWCKGSSFLEIAKMTNVYEGSLIRLFRRLEELLRQMGQAAKVMGSDDLERKFEEALGKIRRDIVSAQSLYL